MTTALRMTLDTFLRDSTIDERRLELIDGEVHEKPMPTWGHATLAGELYHALRPFGWPAVEPRLIVQALASFDPSTPIPDFAFYREAPPLSNAWATRPPNVVAEILSPGQSRRDMRAKIDLYIAFGVDSVWVLDPDAETIEVYEAGGRRILHADDVLIAASVPGFELSVAELFARTRP